MLALVVQHMQLGLVVIEPVFLVEDQRVRLETVPEAKDHIHEFGAALIALGMRRQAFEAEIIAGLVMVGGHDIPAGPPAAQMVDGGEDAGDIIGLVIGVEAVATNPSRSVSTDSAEISDSGSKRFILVGDRASASASPTAAAGESARNMKSNFAASRFSRRSADGRCGLRREHRHPGAARRRD